MHARCRALLRPAFAFALATSLAALMLLPPPGPARAQAGAWSGTVTARATGNPLPNARVRATALADTTDERTTATGDDGRFRLLGLAARAYRVEVARVGYAPWQHTVTPTA